MALEPILTRLQRAVQASSELVARGQRRIVPAGDLDQLSYDQGWLEGRLMERSRGAAAVELAKGGA